MARRFRVGIQLQPQHTSTDELRAAWRRFDSAGVDSIWTWDHFFPLYGDPDGTHFEGMALLAAMAVETSRAQIGMLVACNSYRNPELFADAMRTIDHLSGGRCYLGLGAGWFERDYEEYGYEFGTGPSRLRDLEASLDRLGSRLRALHPGPAGDLPLLIGGGGEKVTLRLVAQYADAWNTFGPPESFERKNRILDQWCAEVGRDPSAIERTVGLLSADEVDQVDDYLAAGATHLILCAGSPFDREPVDRLLALADAGA